MPQRMRETGLMGPAVGGDQVSIECFISNMK